MRREFIAFAAVAAVGLTACGTEDKSFRAVFIADTHIAGPQYECCSETPGIDNASIVRTEERLAEVARRVNAIRPKPDMVFVLGDIMHDPYYSTEASWYSSQRTAFQITAELLGEFDIPVYPLWGNHDYRIKCGDGAYVSREFSHDLFREFFDTEPYYAVDHKGWKFILANSMLGPTWEPGHELCDTGMASYGAEQLAWMEAQLDEGKPTTWLAHYGFVVTQTDEDPGSQIPDVVTLLNRYDERNLTLTMVGHTHRWIDFGDTYGLPHYIMAATRYDVDNFTLVEFDPATGTHELLDFEKGRRSDPCAETWLYDGDPVWDPDQGAEDGDCQ